MRVMLSYDPVFAELLELPELLEVVDHTVSDTAVMHLQNGLILPPFDGSAESNGTHAKACWMLAWMPTPTVTSAS